MNLCKATLCLTLLILPLIGLAKNIGCPSYHPHPGNKLFRVSVFDVIDKQIYELAPSEDKKQGMIARQKWNGFTHQPGAKTYFTCSYSGTPKKITLELSRDIKICRFIFPYPDTEKSGIPARFYCSP
jgi:hypothetical protein